MPNVRGLRSTAGTFAVSILVFIVVSPPALGQREREGELTRLFDRASHLTLEESASEVSANAVIERDALSFTLKSGSVTYATDLYGKRRAAVFVGKGRFDFMPPTKIERDHLTRFFGTSNLRMEFSHAVFFFGDTLSIDSSVPIPSDRGVVEKFLSDGLRQLGEDKRIDDPQWLKCIFERRSIPLFLAYMHMVEGDPLIAGFDPFDPEEIYLTRMRGGMFSVYPDWDVISKFHKKEDYGRTDHEANLTSRHVRRGRVDIDAEFETHGLKSSLTFHGRVTMPMRTTYGAQEWMYFILHPSLMVDSVVLANGRQLQWFARKDHPFFWVRMDTILGPSEERTLTVAYHGDLIERGAMGVFYVKDSRYWFPRFAGENRAMYQMTFRYPDRFLLACAGEMTSERRFDGLIESTWRTKVPTEQLSFYIDDYLRYDVKDDRIPPTSVLMSRTINKSGISISGRNPEEQVGEDLAKSLFFYQNLFGAPIASRLIAAEIPFGHGQAFPGLIHLGWFTFQRTDMLGREQVFRAHEAAHQWWGIDVEPRSYHDWWLAEGLSQFCGILYLQTVEEEKSLYYAMLEKWREDLLSLRKHFLSTGQQSAPIWMGYRTETSSTRGDYQRIVYNKGAWVLHMLRTQLLDLETGNEDIFKSILREFYSKYRNKQVSTVDFQKVIEQITGKTFDWFFDQWVYGSSIPSYTFAYTVENAAEKKFRVKVRVTQKNVPDDFRMEVPILLKFSEGRTARTRVLVTGPITETDLPLVSLYPEDVIFNDMNGVLAEVDTKSW